jgi:hypothetical protein
LVDKQSPSGEPLEILFSAKSGWSLAQMFCAAVTTSEWADGYIAIHDLA